eukprot:CAMPEP_0204611870 /NCGR_PEP_ID=MMETSP0661-20131031/62238_1 /ASSEMBLY_ACC=CAM_ASM_000606 /TAXON_ID=109239 /ORGANISM="Alexandrium margalefi, Strain AMGDE01CS-322" /LENGTH=262 /DNA_ID=CAMNT_0051623715 /DNA_START=182 /DNA_END=969 /DNA_ORIENTATION=+
MTHDDAAPDARTGVARGLRVLRRGRRGSHLWPACKVAAAEVVLVRVDHHGAADHGVLPEDLDELVGNGVLGAAAEVVLVRVDHHGAADHGVLPEDLDELVGDDVLGDTVVAGHDVAQVADVALLVVRASVELAKGVVVGAGARAAFAKVSLLVHVEAVLAWGEALHLILDDDGLGIGLVNFTIPVTPAAVSEPSQVLPASPTSQTALIGKDTPAALIPKSVPGYVRRVGGAIDSEAAGAEESMAPRGAMQWQKQTGPPVALA